VRAESSAKEVIGFQARERLQSFKGASGFLTGLFRNRFMGDVTHKTVTHFGPKETSLSFSLAFTLTTYHGRCSV